MNVLSLFDGLSGGQLALNRAGIKYDKYFASEVDKYAVAVAQHNFPKTIQLGDVLQVQAEDLPKIDLLIGGSPCQGFSFAGKQLNFDDTRSKLFFEFVRLLKECQPKYFMLENVKMKKEYQDVISKYLGVEPIEINSALVSAQNRSRLYWTNISNIEQPEDKGILFQDIFEFGLNDDSLKVGPEFFKGTNTITKLTHPQKPLLFEKAHGWNRGGIREIFKFPTLRPVSVYNYALKDYGGWRKLSAIEAERLQTLPENYTNLVSNHQRHKMIANGWTVDVVAHIFKNLGGICDCNS